MVGEAWKVRSSKYVLNDKWIKVRADDCINSSGLNIQPYYVIENSDFVHVLALDHKDRVILVRQYRHGYAGFSLELPGGMIDNSDSNIIATGDRELREETGYVGSYYTHISTLSADPGRYSNRLHLIGARGVIPGLPQPEPSEDIEVVLVSQEEAMHLAITGGIINVQHVGLLMIGLAPDNIW